VPLTGGFFGKFYVFKAAFEANLVWLAVLGLLNSAVAAYYYLRVIVVMYMHEPGPAVESLPPLPSAMKTAIWSAAAATLALGIYPPLILAFLGRAAALGR
jgi:NADH-quinone oxidoreductase subunit N